MASDENAYGEVLHLLQRDDVAVQVRQLLVDRVVGEQQRHHFAVDETIGVHQKRRLQRVLQLPQLVLELLLRQRDGLQRSEHVDSQLLDLLRESTVNRPLRAHPFTYTRSPRSNPMVSSYL